MFAIIAAAGTGQRMNCVKKQFLKLNNKFILKTIVEKFISANVLSFVIATSKEDLPFAKRILNDFKQNIIFVEGGKTRQESIKNAFLAMYKQHNKNDIVLIHDAARPFFKVDLLKVLISTAKKQGAASLCCPIFDSVKFVENFKIKKTINRDKLFLSQTPQAFKISLYKKALDMAKTKNILVTDDCELIEKLNIKITPIISSKTNFKITTTEDLKYAQFLINQQPGDYNV